MHIHQFPYISDIFLKIIKGRYYNKKIYPWVRNSQTLSANRNIKNILLNYYGYNIKKKCIKNNIFTNLNFEGVYDFSQKFNINKYYNSKFKNLILKKGTLFMVHPGKNYFLADVYDEIYNYRINEFNFLKSNLFKKLLNKYKIKLRKLKKVLKF